MFYTPWLNGQLHLGSLLAILVSYIWWCATSGASGNRAGFVLPGAQCTKWHSHLFALRRDGRLFHVVSHAMFDQELSRCSEWCISFVSRECSGWCIFPGCRNSKSKRLIIHACQAVLACTSPAQVILRSRTMWGSVAWTLCPVALTEMTHNEFTLRELCSWLLSSLSVCHCWHVCSRRIASADPGGVTTTPE